MQISMFLGFGMMFGLIAVGRIFAPIFFGSDFQETGVLIQFLAVTIIISGWKAVLRSQYIIPYEKDKAYVISLVAGAVVNVICNYFFIQLYQARGAVIGTIAAELVGFIIQTAVAANDIDIWKLMREGLIFVFPGLTMWGIVEVFLSFTKGGIVPLCCSILIGAITYLILGTITMQLFDRERLKYYRQRYFNLRRRK